MPHGKRSERFKLLLVLLLPMPITKDTPVATALGEVPEARKIFSDHGIRFIGRDVSPLESVDVVAKGNGLAGDQIAAMIAEINAISEKVLDPTDAIMLTPAAAARLKEFLARKTKRAVRLRLVSSGCSVYSYDIDAAAKSSSTELDVVSQGVHVLVEKKHLALLKGTVIDFDVKEQGFVFRNPNVRE